MCDFCTTRNRQPIESNFSASIQLSKGFQGPPSLVFNTEIYAGDLGTFEDWGEIEIKYCPFCGEQLYECEDEYEGDEDEN